MMMQEIWINNVLMDIDEDTKINLDIKSNLFTEISKISSNRTYTIKLPKTAHNLKAIEYSHLPQNGTMFPYTYQNARYVRNGIEIFSDGYAYILNVSETIEIVIIWGIPSSLKEIFSNGQMLNEITDDGKTAPYVRYNNVDLWSNLASKRTNDGYCYAAIDYLKYTGSPIAGIYTSDEAIARMPKMGYLRPSIFLRHILNRLQTIYGINFNVSQSMNDWLDTIIFPCCTANCDSIGTNVVASAIGGRFELTQTDTVIFPISEVGDWYSLPWISLIPACDIHAVISYSYTFPIENVDENYLRGLINDKLIGIWVFTDAENWYQPSALITVRDSNGNVRDVINSGTNLTDDWKISVTGGISVDIPENTLFWYHIKYGKTYNWAADVSGTFILTPYAKSVLYGMNYPLTANFPNMKVTDFLQWVAVMTGTFPKQVSANGIEFVPYSTIFTDTANAVDWSDKLVRAYNDNAPKTIDFTVDGWAQRNDYKYSENDDYGTFADGYFSLSNAQLETQNDIINGEFEATKPSNNIPIYKTDAGDDTATLKAYLFPDQDETGDVLEFDSCDPRILVAQVVIVNNVEYIQGYFDMSLYWSTILSDSRYEQLITSLQNIKVLHEVFRLTESDLKTFDETKPVYLAQYGHYYAVTEIKTSETGTAEVTLFQLEL